jgi:phosphohistidine phosphatase
LLAVQPGRLQTRVICGHTGPMRRRLIVLRHAKSDWSGGVTDHDRPLAGRGRREAALAGRWLRENAADIDLVVCSSATRARQTWKLVAKQLDNIPPSRVDDRLYAASIRSLLAIIRKLPDSARAVLLIGHNPGLEELVADLGGVGWPMKTSSIAVLSSRSEWAQVGARWAKLEASLTPRS